MSRLFRVLMVLMLVLFVSAPTWAVAGSKKESKRYSYYRSWSKYKKFKVWIQYKRLIRAYHRAGKDARQKFHNKVGTGQTDTSGEIQRIREEYEQQIAQLNSTIASNGQQIAQLNNTIASNEQQIAQLNSTIASNGQQIAQLNSTIAANEQQIAQLNSTIAANGQQIAQLSSTIAANDQQIVQLNSTIAANDQQIAQLNTTITTNEQQIAQLNATIAAHDQELADLRASNVQDMDDLRAEHQAEVEGLTTEWTQFAETEFARGLEEGAASCNETPQGTGTHPLANSWSTGGASPGVIDVDASGVVHILDPSERTVVRYDASGDPAPAWGSPSFEAPVDLVTDSEGNIFVLDRQSEYHLQKYSSEGASFDMPSTYGMLFNPTGMFMDSSDTLYVTDNGGQYGGRIVLMTSSGDMMMTFGEVQQLSDEVYRDVAVNPRDQFMYVLTDSRVAVFNEYGNYVTDWAGSFTAPTGLSIGAQGEIYVVDAASHQVFEYDASGTLISTFGTEDLMNPGRPDVGVNGSIYVGDSGDRMVKVFE